MLSEEETDPEMATFYPLEPKSREEIKMMKRQMTLDFNSPSALNTNKKARYMKNCILESPGEWERALCLFLCALCHIGIAPLFCNQSFRFIISSQITVVFKI